MTMGVEDGRGWLCGLCRGCALAGNGRPGEVATGDGRRATGTGSAGGLYGVLIRAWGSNGEGATVTESRVWVVKGSQWQSSLLRTLRRAQAQAGGG